VIRGPEFVSGGQPESGCLLRNSGALIIRSNSAVRATGVEDSRRFLRELGEAPGGNTLHYILQCLHIPALVTRVWTRKVYWVATECSWNDGSETQYYIVILDWLQGCSGGLERVPELRIRGPLTSSRLEKSIEVHLADVSWGSWVLLIVLCNKVWCLDIRGHLPKVVFPAKTLLLDQELELPLVPATI